MPHISSPGKLTSTKASRERPDKKIASAVSKTAPKKELRKKKDSKTVKSNTIVP